MFFVNQKLRVLAVGAHPDDIELGSGGFIWRLVQECSAKVHFLILTSGLKHRNPGVQYEGCSRRDEARASARELGVSGESCVQVLNHADCMLDRCHHELIEEIQKRLSNENGNRSYDLVLTHAGSDMHLDHLHAHDATISAARDFSGMVLLYQSPSTIPNQFKPIFFVDLNDDALNHKKCALMKHVSQRDKPFLDNGRIEGLAKSWAIFHRTPNKHLEAFEVHKTFWDRLRV